MRVAVGACRRFDCRSQDDAPEPASGRGGDRADTHATESRPKKNALSMGSGAMSGMPTIAVARARRGLPDFFGVQEPPNGSPVAVLLNANPVVGFGGQIDLTNFARYGAECCAYYRERGRRLARP
jgi:hypothetical protein